VNKGLVHVILKVFPAVRTAGSAVEVKQKSFKQNHHSECLQFDWYCQLSGIWSNQTVSPTAWKWG